jgi:peptidoglycan/xylan/chitin deacetylase (PgdA/CDA1 family)
MNSPLSPTKSTAGNRRAALNLVGGALWRAPGCFDVARLLGPRYCLRSVLFHDISDTESWFTKGMGVTITREDFEGALRFITRHYTPVSLQDVITDFAGRDVPSRPVLVTFDDAYTSVCEFAAPMCAKLGVPAVFFVNGACLDNRQLALDNLVCYVANHSGLSRVNAAIRAVEGGADLEVRSLTQVFSSFLLKISPRDRGIFRNALIEIAGLDEAKLALEASLYISSQQLRELAAFNFEIGNHTYSHVNCRSLSSVAEFVGEIGRNHQVLEAASSTKVRSFSVPYGSSVDLTPALEAHLVRSGYKAAFLSESVANRRRPDRFRLNRISIKTGGDSLLFSEIEILPRLRTIRNMVFGSAVAEPIRKISNESQPLPAPASAAVADHKQ